jgi:UDP-N-acetylmuramoyl-L-alanyl-D-glutamate--2,6-diaminopimelate ligase
MIIELNSPDISQNFLKERGIRKIVYDSREAGPDTLFCALTGTHTDGHNFLDKAKAQGCTNFLISNTAYAETFSKTNTYFLTADTRKGMAKLSAVFYGRPSRRIKVIGVTGTDGKSTTAYLIQQLLEFCGHKTGLISTVSLKTGTELLDNTLRQSTPEAPQIDEALAQMLEHGMEYAVIESTSHGLAEETGRLSEIDFIAGVFTNVTIEHLEFHGTLEKYRHDKANLFRKVAANHGISVINKEDPHYKLFEEAARGSAATLLYGRDASAALWSSDEKALVNGNHFMLNTAAGSAEVFISLPGMFNIENTLAAVSLTAAVLSKDPLSLVPYIEQLKTPKGRMKVIQREPFSIIVDYAHTPGSFEKLLPQVKTTLNGRMIVLFGSGGERNKEKRPIQGALADSYADIIFLTDEDPRLEDSMTILNDIKAGIKGKNEGQSLFLISNRREAMKKAFSIAEKNDVVLLLGKGHEASIITAQGKMDWDEEQVACELLEELKLNGG